MLIVRLSKRPQCNHVRCKEDSHFDARSAHGLWGYFCAEHFIELCDALGEGFGQIIQIDGDNNIEEINVVESEMVKEVRKCNMEVRAFGDGKLYLLFMHFSNLPDSLATIKLLCHF